MSAHWLWLLVVFAAMGLLALPIFINAHKKGHPPARLLSYLLCYGSFCFILFLTIFYLRIHFAPEERILNLRPFAWLGDELIRRRVFHEILPNIAMFVPFGLFVPAAFPRLRKPQRTALAAFALTFVVEFFQYFIGRSADVDDLIANLLGGLLGCALFALLNRILRGNHRWKRFVGAES